MISLASWRDLTDPEHRNKCSRRTPHRAYCQCRRTRTRSLFNIVPGFIRARTCSRDGTNGHCVRVLRWRGGLFDPARRLVDRYATGAKLFEDFRARSVWAWHGRYVRRQCGDDQTASRSNRGMVVVTASALQISHLPGRRARFGVKVDAPPSAISCSPYRELYVFCTFCILQCRSCRDEVYPFAFIFVLLQTGRAAALG